MANKHKTFDYISHWGMQRENTFGRTHHTTKVKWKGWKIPNNLKKLNKKRVKPI